jgi:DNA polymerase-3 subunit alpha
MPNTLRFDCGCEFVASPDPSGQNRHFVEFNPDIETMNLSCPKTWDLISSGNTKGCFQLESRLGQSMAKKLKPENIEQLSALISILRPGCLEAIRDGKSVSNHYIDRKNGLESIDYFHGALEKTLQKTYGEMIYQEQAMEIAQNIAGFDLKEADMLRKAIGKKKPEEMAKIKTKFLSGAQKVGIVTGDQADEIFGWIEKSQRYSFNKSHAISYAINAYLSAYTKAHFPRIFFASYLRFAKDKIDPQQEIKELVRNANEMGITIHIPNFKLLNKYFSTKDKDIYFGLTDIKGVGNSVFEKIMSLTDHNSVQNYSWLDVLSIVLINITSTAAKAIISCGGFDYMKKNRTEMLFELEILSNLTKKELEIFRQIYTSNNLTNIKAVLSTMVTDETKINKNRKKNISDLIKMIEKPPYSLIDKIEWLSDSESSLLGAAITCSKLDTYDISMANTNCKDVKNSIITDNIIIAGEISNVNAVKTKKGKNPGQEMAFITIEDNTGIMDSMVLFPEAWNEYKHHIFNGNILIFVGNKTKNKDALVVEKCFIPAS